MAGHSLFELLKAGKKRENLG